LSFSFLAFASIRPAAKHNAAAFLDGEQSHGLGAFCTISIVSLAVHSGQKHASGKLSTQEPDIHRFEERNP
jgi:hypothetical protein